MPFKCVLHNRFLMARQLRALRKNERNYSSKNILKIQERGMFLDIFPEKCANEVYDIVTKKPQTVYAGFDPTAPSLHVGNLLVLLNLFHWQRNGHQAIVLLGGATGLIGDPSGRKTERSILFKSEVDKNCNEIEQLLLQIFDNHESAFYKNCSGALKPIRIVNNADWYRNMNALELIGDIGRHFRIGTMLSKQIVKDRLNSGSGMSYTEFTYQILQAYDWFHLFQKHNCLFQIGGSDQHGNIVAGYEFIQRMTEEKVYGLTVPLVTDEEGDKYGKSMGNPVWLSSSRTSPFQLYQFFIRTKDSEVQKLLMLYTFERISRILEIMNEHWKNPEKKLAQKILAEQVTLLIHGEDGLRLAEKTTDALYSRSAEFLNTLDVSDIKSVFQGATLIELLLKPGTTILEAALNAKCFKTERDAMRIISAGGFYINQQRIENFQEVITPSSHILPSNITLMRVGKKNYTIVKWL